MFTIFQWSNVIFSCFRRSLLNFTLALVLTKSYEGLRILFHLVGGLILSLDNPLDFHDAILLLLALTVLKYLYIGWNIKQFCAPSSSKWLWPRKLIESNVFNFFNSFSVSKCFVLSQVIFLLRLDSFASKSVFVIKFACTNLAAKFSAVSLLNSGVVIYLSWLSSLSFFPAHKYLCHSLFSWLNF